MAPLGVFGVEVLRTSQCFLDTARFFVYDVCEMACEEKVRLLEAYVVATAALVTATTTLQLKTGAEFCKALTASEAARAKCVKARLALRDHKTRCEACGLWRRRKQA